MGFQYQLKFATDLKGGPIKVLFGSQNTFGIESEYNSSVLHPTGFFGYICFWIGNHPIGDFQEFVMLDIPALHMKDTLRFEGQRRDSTINNQQAEVILETVYKALWGNYDFENEDFQQLKNRFQRFSICPGGGEAFDGIQCVLVDEDESERMIWRWIGPPQENQPLSEVPPQEIRLQKGHYEKVVRHFLDWFNNLKKPEGK